MKTLQFTTSRHIQLLPITSAVREALAALPPWSGLLYVYSPNTTAAVTVNEQADPDVAADLEKIFARLVPLHGGYAHAEGNSAAHAQTTLVGPGVWVPVANGRLALGTWQGLYLCEFDGPRTRTVQLHPMPSPANLPGDTAP